MSDSVQLTKTQVIMARGVYNERARIATELDACQKAVTEFIELMRITHEMPPGDYGIAPDSAGLVLSRVEEDSADEENDDDESDQS